ncbi:DNA polymerase III subunit delta [Thiopseudomonas alkaliphila]|uniref:DNA polymerase III subunit delta n=1 Tax=Thiopseudomonas alkaliphila TaxID=1697053 RepID=A0AAW7DUT8_9GAMM|nr:DNA polymerase III subunit delta [Thiopseudomonas alkaliphila]MDM1696443.1 DNA polymerase III subunit delta [Thiopseudomonas alkaliphila]
MQLKTDKLSQQLQQKLLPVYWVSGDELLLCQEACDKIRATCRQQGFDERQVLNADRSFDWGLLYEAGASLSLFAQKRLIELRLSSSKPGDKGAKALQEYLARPPVDTVLLINSPRFDSATLKTKWAKALLDSQDCALLQVQPIARHGLSAWIQQRLSQQGFSADLDALELIVTRVEGNLLAAVQEIEKLKLLTDETHLSLAVIQAAIADSSRYDVFSLTDAALAGDIARTVRIINGLRHEGTEIPLLLWAVARDLRQLAQASQKAQQLGIDAALRHVWPAPRKTLFAQALKRLTPKDLAPLFLLAQQIDEQGKGQAPGDAWSTLTEVLLKLAGQPIFTQ